MSKVVIQADDTSYVMTLYNLFHCSSRKFVTLITSVCLLLTFPACPSVCVCVCMSVWVCMCVCVCACVFSTVFFFFFYLTLNILHVKSCIPPRLWLWEHSKITIQFPVVSCFLYHGIYPQFCLLVIYVWGFQIPPHKYTNVCTHYSLCFNANFCQLWTELWDVCWCIPSILVQQTLRYTTGSGMCMYVFLVFQLQVMSQKVMLQSLQSLEYRSAVIKLNKSVTDQQILQLNF